MTLVVDTHTLLWFLADDARLGREAKQALSRREGIEIIVPIIVLFEIMYLQKRRSLSISLQDVRHWIAVNPHVRVFPTDISVFETSPSNMEIHDSMIVGTAITLATAGAPSVQILTCDKAITAAKMVPVLW